MFENPYEPPHEEGKAAVTIKWQQWFGWLTVAAIGAHIFWYDLLPIIRLIQALDK